MKLTDFRYELEGLNIPEEPLEQRDDARLMVLNRAEQTIDHKKFSDIHEYLNEGDVLIYNNTKVFPARLNGKKEKTEADIKYFYSESFSQKICYGMYWLSLRVKSVLVTNYISERKTMS